MRSLTVKAPQRAERRSLRRSSRPLAISSRIAKRMLDAAKQAVAGDDSKRHEAISCDILARIHLAIADNIIWRSRPRGVSDRRAK
jgi:hypothetical protein